VNYYSSPAQISVASVNQSAKPIGFAFPNSRIATQKPSPLFKPPEATRAGFSFRYSAQLAEAELAAKTDIEADKTTTLRAIEAKRFMGFLRMYIDQAIGY
jgi:hypothetical protein